MRRSRDQGRGSAGLVRDAGTMAHGINWNARTIRDAFFESTRTAAVEKSLLAEDFGAQISQDEDDPDEYKAALAQWNAMNGDEETFVVNGYFNRELFAAARAVKWAEWNERPDIQEYVLANTNRTHIPPELLQILPATTRTRNLQSQAARKKIMDQMVRDGELVAR